MVVDKATEEKSQTRQQRRLVAHNVRRLRTARGWSQSGLAARAEIHRTHLARFETQATNISLDVIFRLANALDVPAHELLIAKNDRSGE